MTAEEILHQRVSSDLTDRWAWPVKQAVLSAIEDARDMGYKDGWEQAMSVAVEAVNNQYGTPKFPKKDEVKHVIKTDTNTHSSTPPLLMTAKEVQDFILNEHASKRLGDGDNVFLNGELYRHILSHFEKNFIVKHNKSEYSFNFLKNVKFNLTVI